MLTLFRKGAFALANTVAVLSALGIAMAFGLDRPYWAMFTVFIIAKPMSGAVRSKAVYRLAGTLAGAAMAVFLVPPLVQSPALLCLAMSAWVGMCLYFSLLDRTPRSYAFMLAGYTATIVGFSVVGSPETVFDTAVARIEEISLGIVCGSIAHSIFFPQNITSEINEKLARTIRACADWIGKSLTRPLGLEDEAAHRRLAQVVTDLQLLYTHVSFETSDVQRAGGVMRALQDRLTRLSAYLTTLQKSVQALATQAPLRAPMLAALASVSSWARTLADGREGGADSHDMVPSAPVAPDESQSDRREWESLLEQAVVVYLGKLVRALQESSVLAAALRGRAATLPGDLQREAAMSRRRSLHLDRGVAALSGCAAAVSCLIACVLWIQGSWPEGAVAAQFAAIGCSVFATLDRPAKVIGSAIAGVLLALPFSALYEFAIFPRIDGFASLALVLAPAVLLFSLMQTSEKLEGAALVLAIGFSGGLALQSTYRADFAAFVNTNTAEVMGLLVADVTVLVFRTIDPLWSAVRISRAGWRSMSRLADATETDMGAWSTPMFDRLGLVASRLPQADSARITQGRVDPLRDLRVGLNVAAIRQAEDGAGPGVPAALRRVLTEVSGAYEALARGRPLALPSDMQASIDAGIASLSRQPAGASVRDVLAALTALRLDLAPCAAPYRSPLPVS
jgi:uncharacterized membrane protein YccC